jgi:hypothetical protein
MFFFFLQNHLWRHQCANAGNHKRRTTPSEACCFLRHTYTNAVKCVSHAYTSTYSLNTLQETESNYSKQMTKCSICLKTKHFHDYDFSAHILWATKVPYNFTSKILDTFLSTQAYIRLLWICCDNHQNEKETHRKCWS